MAQQQIITDFLCQQEASRPRISANFSRRQRRHLGSTGAASHRDLRVDTRQNSPGDAVIAAFVPPI